MSLGGFVQMLCKEVQLPAELGGRLHGVHLGTMAAETLTERQGERTTSITEEKLSDVQDPTTATLEWSTILLRSYLMEAGLSIVEEGGLIDSSNTCFRFSQEQVAELNDDDDDEDDNIWMDELLWSRLPEILVERIMALLPLASFFRMRLVCKRWYHLLFSDSFLEMCTMVSPSRPWFLLFRQGNWTEAFVFDPAPTSQTWFRITLSSLPEGFSVVASAGGLLCCISQAAGRKTVRICNPLTRACMQLPCTLKERFLPTVGMLVHKPTKSYQIMVAGDDMISPFAVKNLTTELYDSTSQSWTRTSPLPRLCNLESGKTTHASGFLYCMNYSPFSVLAYDMQQGVWSKIQAPMRRFLRTPNLVECRGRLMLVAAVEKNKLNVPKSIRIWGLQSSKTSWVELERMPQSLYEEFMRVSGEKAFNCIGHGNIILITLNDTPDMLLFDFYQKLWRWAPRCPFLSPSDHHAAQGFNAFPFDPRLEASIC